MTYVSAEPLPGSLPTATPDLVSTAGPELEGDLAAFRYTSKKGDYTIDVAARERYANHRTLWFKVEGTFEDALAGARSVAQYEDDPWYRDNNVPARTSAAVVAAGEGAWLIGKLSAPDDEMMDMPAILSLPVETLNADDYEISFPFFSTWGPTTAEVEIRNPNVLAIVGAESWIDNRPS